MQGHGLHGGCVWHLRLLIGSRGHDTSAGLEVKDQNEDDDDDDDDDDDVDENDVERHLVRGLAVVGCREGDRGADLKGGFIKGQWTREEDEKVHALRARERWEIVRWETGCCAWRCPPPPTPC